MTLPMAELILPSISSGPGGSDDLADKRLGLAALRAGAEDLDQPRRAGAFQRLGLMIDVWECLADDSPRRAAEVSAFCAEAFEKLVAEVESGQDFAPDWVIRESSARWGDYLRLLDTDVDTDPVAAWPTPSHEYDRDDTPSAIDASALFQMLTGDSPVHDAIAPAFSLSAAEERVVFPPSPLAGEGQGVRGPAHQAEFRPPLTPNPSAARREGDRIEDPRPVPFEVPAPPTILAIDQDMRETFLGEAGDLFDRIETLVLSLGRGQGQAETLHELARCFHTLKGASGSVGLFQLTALIHAMEEQLEHAEGEANDGLIDLLHRLLHYLEGVFIALRRNGPAAVEAPQPIDHSPAAPAPTADGPPIEGLVRVSAERIDELMDLASELISRRGLWSAQAGTMKQFATQARTTRARLLNSIDRLRDLQAAPDSEAPELIRRLAEQADDLVVLADSAQANAAPLSDNSDALARLSLQLWESLQAVRIVPVRGLFQRLARVAHDAARMEGRHVEVMMNGEDTGVDRAVQDKAFEPLLHVVRNAVCHGIEPPDDRRESGKPSIGRVTLDASRTGNTLTLSVGDDGRGLDYAAIESKGRRLGLIAPGDAPTTERLNALIFQSGFSTREQAGAIAGRGVGMDVVSQEVARLHGSIALGSRAGEGTTLSLSLPARLALQQSMILRVDGQAFALPIELIDLVQPFDADFGKAPSTQARVRDDWVPMISARKALGLSETAPVLCPKLLLIRADGGPLAVLADAIEGTSELVIKPLGPLLARHPLISGTSLSVTGEAVFALNPTGLAHCPRECSGSSPPSSSSPRPAPILVVDDSISVRTVVARQLRGLGYVVEEVSDGLEALGKIRNQVYSLVLSDMEMPRMDGLELLAELHRLAIAPAVPVVIASTRSDPETRRRVLALGARRFIPKPIEPEVLAATARDLIPGAARTVAEAI